MSTGKATEYAAVQNALNDARRNGRTLTEENVAAIRREAAELGRLADHAEFARFGYENLVRGPLQTFRQELQNGASWFDAIKKAGLNALDLLSSKLMDIASRKSCGKALSAVAAVSVSEACSVAAERVRLLRMESAASVRPYRRCTPATVPAIGSSRSANCRASIPGSVPANSTQSFATTSWC